MFNAQAHYNKNMYQIFNGVDEDVLKQIGIDSDKFVRKLENPINPQ